MSDDRRDGRISTNTVIALIALVLSVVSFFLILLLWNSNPQDVEVDTLSFSITVLETVLGVLAVLLAFGAFAGFWMIRTSAVEAAREEARRKIDEMAPELIKEAGRLAGASRGATEDQKPSLKISETDESDVLKGATKLGEDEQ